MQTVFVIIVNYTNANLTIQCIESLKKSDGVYLCIIIIDNASPDDSFEILSNYVKSCVMIDVRISILRSPGNNGFAAGNNIGIEYAIRQGAEYILLLNNDTVVDPKMINTLLRNCDSTTVVAPSMYFYDHPSVFWFAGGKYLPRSGRFIHIGENEQDKGQFTKIENCDFLTGCCILLSAEVVKSVGLLSEEYFMYVEDVDYSLGLISKGIKLYVIPQAKLWHKVGASSGKKSKMSIYYSNRNRLYLLKKYGYPRYVRFIALITRILLMIKGFLFNTNEKYILYSIIDFFAGRMGKRS